MSDIEKAIQGRERAFTFGSKKKGEDLSQQNLIVTFGPEDEYNPKSDRKLPKKKEFSPYNLSSRKYPIMPNIMQSVKVSRSTKKLFEAKSYDS